MDIFINYRNISFILDPMETKNLKSVYFCLKHPVVCKIKLVHFLAFMLISGVLVYCLKLWIWDFWFWSQTLKMRLSIQWTWVKPLDWDWYQVSVSVSKSKVSLTSGILGILKCCRPYQEGWWILTKSHIKC